MRSSTSSPLDDQLKKNLEYARYGMEKISEEYPYGGINRYDVSSSLNEVDFYNQIRFFIIYRDMVNKDSPSIKDTAALMFALSKLKGAFCGELAHFTKIEILKKYPNAIVEVVSLTNSQHGLLVIGRKEGSDPNNIDSWGESAVLCDPWAKKIYKVSQFWDVRYNCNDIKFFRLYDNEPDEVKVHYLSGEPKILPENQYFPVDALALRNKKL